MFRARHTNQLSLTGSLDLDPYDFRNPGLQALGLLRLGLTLGLDHPYKLTPELFRPLSSDLSDEE